MPPKQHHVDTTAKFCWGSGWSVALLDHSRRSFGDPGETLFYAVDFEHQGTLSAAFLVQALFCHINLHKLEPFVNGVLPSRHLSRFLFDGAHLFSCLCSSWLKLHPCSHASLLPNKVVHYLRQGQNYYTNGPKSSYNRVLVSSKIALARSS